MILRATPGGYRSEWITTRRASPFGPSSAGGVEWARRSIRKHARCSSTDVANQAWSRCLLWRLELYYTTVNWIGSIISGHSLTQGLLGSISTTWTLILRFFSKNSLRSAPVSQFHRSPATGRTLCIKLEGSPDSRPTISIDFGNSATNSSFSLREHSSQNSSAGSKSLQYFFFSSAAVFASTLNPNNRKSSFTLFWSWPSAHSHSVGPQLSLRPLLPGI